MAEIRWIKLRIDMFDDEKIKIIQSMPEGDAILVIWIRIIALAGKCNSNGLVLVEDEFPYTDEMLSVIFGKPLSTVKLALATFEKFRMIENTEKGIYITNFDKHQNIEGLDKIREQNRIRKQRERERKRALLLEESGSGVPALPDNGPAQNKEVTDLSRDISREVTQQREKEEKEKDNNISISSNENIDIDGGTSAAGDAGAEYGRTRIDYQHIMTDFHDTCIDFPTIRAMSEARKKKIRTLLNEFDKLKIWPDVTIYDRLHRLFVMAQDSDFLSGRNQKWNGCSFDWIINKTNALKIVEGNYTNKGAEIMTQAAERTPEAVQGIAIQAIEHLKVQRAQHLKDSGETAPDYKCQKCRDTGYYELEKDGYTYMRECECGKIQQERIKSKLAFAAIPKEFEGQTVDNFRTDCYSTAEGRELAEMAKTIAKRYVEIFDEIQETNAKGLYFHSGVKGSGKTRLAVSIANDLISLKGIPAKFSTTIQILDQIKNTWGERARGRDEINQARTEESLIRDIVSVPVLIVDDIGVEQPKDWINERFYNILNGRMIEKRITIFTSNYRIEELQLDDRIVSRIDKMTLPIEFPSESVRAAISRKENNDLMDRLLGI